MKKLTTIVLGAALLLGSTAYAGNYQAPKLSQDGKTAYFLGDSYSLKKGFKKDMNEDNKIDTYVQFFKSADGKKMLRYTSKKKTWGWTIWKNPSDKTDKVNNYTILDLDNIKGYESKIGRGEEIPTPGWIK